MARTGRPSVFPKGPDAVKLGALVSADAAARLEHHREVLGVIINEELGRRVVPSTAEVMEFLLFGVKEAKARLRRLR